jgi:hypothetical protein
MRVRFQPLHPEILTAIHARPTETVLREELQKAYIAIGELRVDNHHLRLHDKYLMNRDCDIRRILAQAEARAKADAAKAKADAAEIQRLKILAGEA